MGDGILFSSSRSTFIVRERLMGTTLLRDGVLLMFLRRLPLNTSLLFKASFRERYLDSISLVGIRLPYLVDKLGFLLMSGRKSENWLLPSVTSLLLVFSETSVVKRVFSVFC